MLKNRQETGQSRVAHVSFDLIFKSWLRRAWPSGNDVTERGAERRSRLVGRAGGGAVGRSRRGRHDTVGTGRRRHLGRQKEPAVAVSRRRTPSS